METVADQHAHFTALAREVELPLRRYVARRVPADAVDDVLADVLMVLWRRRGDVPTDDPLPWSYAVARGCVANNRRSAQRRLRLVERLAHAERPARAAAPQADGADHSDVHAALGRLRELDREVVRLWAWEGLAPREIAVVTGLTPNAVSIRLHKAKKQLAAELGQDGAAAGQEPGEGRRSR